MNVISSLILPLLQFLLCSISSSFFIITCICMYLHIYMYIWVCVYTCIYNLLSEFSIICVCLHPRLSTWGLMTYAGTCPQGNSVLEVEPCGIPMVLLGLSTLPLCYSSPGHHPASISWVHFTWQVPKTASRCPGPLGISSRPSHCILLSNGL